MSEETAEELFARMFCDNKGNTVPPPCTEEELMQAIDSTNEAIKKAEKEMFCPKKQNKSNNWD